MGDRKADFIARLEGRGEAGVREDMALDRYGGDHIGWAKLWLSVIDQGRIDASQSESLDIARSAKDAAWAAAEAARDAAHQAQSANRIAKLALAAAAVAIAAPPIISAIFG